MIKNDTMKAPSTFSQSRYALYGLALAAAVIVCDQLTKWWAFELVLRKTGAALTFPQWIGATMADIDPAAYGVLPLLPFFNLVTVWNQGVSFGMFSSGAAQTVLMLSAVAFTVSAALLAWLWRAENRLIATALGCIIGGALGNVIDRLRFGAVADFLDFFAGQWHWPAFNLADSAIFIGAALLMFDALFGHNKGEA
jgi:signal peptidase II